MWKGPRLPFSKACRLGLGWGLSDPHCQPTDILSDILYIYIILYILYINIYIHIYLCSVIICDIHIWQTLWHSVWHSFWHIFCHCIWHSIWHSVWHFLWYVFGSRRAPLHPKIDKNHLEVCRCPAILGIWMDMVGASWGYTPYLVRGWATPLKNMSSSVGMMKFPIIMEKIIQMFQTTNHIYTVTIVKKCRFAQKFEPYK